MERYGAVILHYELGERLTATLDALITQTCPPSHIIVVDNASKKKIPSELLQAEYPQVEFMERSVNSGYSGGMNAGLQAMLAQFDRILLLTHEVILEVDAVYWMLKEFNVAGHTALVGPVLNLPDGTVWSCGGELSGLGVPRHRSRINSKKAPQWLDGACLLACSHCLQALPGPLDEDYFLYWEDVDLGHRLARLGRISVAARSQATQDTNFTPAYYMYRNYLVFWKKHGTAYQRIRAVALVLAARIVRRSRGAEIRRAYRDAKAV